MKIRNFLVSLSFLGILVAPAYANAVPLFNDVCRGNRADSSVCKDANLKDPATGEQQNPLYGPNGIITVAVKLLSLVVGIAAVLGIIVAGIKYLTSGSNPEEANKARELIIYAVIGLILATVAQLLVRVVLNQIGV